MHRKIFLIAVIIFTVIGVQAQSFSIKGKIQDQESKLAVQGASVSLKSISDSTYAFNAVSDAQGGFEFTGLRKDSFYLRFSSITNEALARKVVVDNADVNLGTIILPKSAKELTGVTVTAAAPPVVQKQDTLQMSASQYKVNPDATSEDLVKKMPGITIENGQVKAQGENVKRVTVDGRELFGDDATAALRNLPAEIVDKIQVFDRLSDQAQLTGFNDGNTTKEINIVTKANMRNGQYGRVFAGYGTNNRYYAGGNTSFLKGNRRISLVGNFNNINQQNFSSQDLLGVTSSGGGRGGNFGGGGGQRGGGGQGGGQRGGGQQGGGGNFLVGQQPGINKTNAAGINFSDVWGTKVRISGSYFFNNSVNETIRQTNTQYTDKSVIAQSDSSFTHNTNHRFNLRLEYKIDSQNQIIFTPNISFQNNKSTTYSHTSSFADTTRLSNIDNTNINNRTGNNLSSNFLFNHTFRKRGRAFSVNLNTGFNERSGDSHTDVLTRRYFNSSTIDTLERRRTDQYNNGLQLNTNLTYNEPLSANSQLQFNYNPSYSKSRSNQQAYNYDPSSKDYSTFNNNASNVFTNTTTAQNAGIAYRYGTRDNQVNLGVNYQETALKSNRQFPKPLSVDKSFQNILPNANFRFKLSTRSSVRLFYRTQTNQPNVTQLQDVLDLTNAPYYSIGNPDLKQQYSHTINSNYTFTNVQKGVVFVGNVFAQKTANYIANSTFLINRKDTVVNGETLRKGSQLVKPVNLDGYMNLRSFLTFAVPLKFIKTQLNMNGGVSYTKQPEFLNNQPTSSQAYVYSMGVVLASNVSQYVDFTVSYSPNFNRVNSKTQSNGDTTTKYFNHVGSLQLNLLSKKGWFFQNDLTNQMYSGLTDGYNQNYWLWNMSAGKKILKGQKGEIKASVFDLLKQNRSITRIVTGSYIQDVSNEVLRQYFMLTFTYKLSSFGKGNSNSNNMRNEENRDFRREGGGMPPRF